MIYLLSLLALPYLVADAAKRYYKEEPKKEKETT